MSQNFIFALLAYFDKLPAALFVSLSITAQATFIGIILGLLIAIAARSRFKVLSLLAQAFVSIFRSIPIPPFLYLVYFTILSYIFPIMPVRAGGLALGVLLAPYMAELFRSGLQSVRIGHIEAGLALGMSNNLLYRRIIIPLAIRIMLPAIGQQIVGALLNSAFVAVLGGRDITGMSRIIIDALFTSELYLIVAITYFVIAFPISRGLSYLENRWKRYA